MSRAQTTIAATTTLNIIATFSVILRIISRFFVLKKPSADDYLIVFGLVMSWCLTALTFARELNSSTLSLMSAEHLETEVHFGLGQHEEDVSSERVQNMLLVSYDMQQSIERKADGL